MSIISSILEEKIKHYAQKYYEDGTSEISDEEFDRLVDELRKLDPNSPVLRIGWGYNVNDDSTPGAKVKHKYGLVGSLDKCHSWNEIPTSMKSFDNLYFSLKLDGISVVLYYEYGKLVDAVTRGDGTTGISIKDKIACIDKSLLTVEDTFSGAVRGEILMTYPNFEKFRKNNPEAKNPRNVVAGLVSRKDDYEDLKYVDIVVYQVVGCETVPAPFYDISTMLEWLKSNFCYVVYSCCQPSNFSSASFEEFLNQLKERWYGLYPADGIVITSWYHFNPNTDYIQYDAIAYKYPSEVKTSRVIGVTWEMSKTHYAIPIVNIEPVQLAGTTVENVTGHNAKFIAENRIGLGAVVEVTKANEIIPHIENVVHPQINFQLIENCPSCNERLVWNGVHLECKNDRCPNAVWQDTLCWINNIAPLDNFGDQLRMKYLTDLYGEQVVSVEDIMSEKELGSKYMQGGAQDKLFVEMLNLLHTRPLILSEALLALNIPRLGDKTCSKLSQYPEVVERIMNEACYTCDPLSLLDLNGYIGDANADSIRSNLWKFSRLKFIWNRVVFMSFDLASKGKVAITGKLSVKRSEFERELKSAGYEPTSTVNKDTKFLITDNPNSSSSKNAAADKFGIVKISEEEFRKEYM